MPFERVDDKIIMAFQPTYLVSPEDMDRLVQKHKETLMENNVLTKAARVTAEREVALNSDMPPALKEAVVKDLGKDLRTWTKAVRLPGGGEVEADTGLSPPNLSEGPVMHLLKNLVKKEPGKSPEPITPSGFTTKTEWTTPHSIEPIPSYVAKKKAIKRKRSSSQISIKSLTERKHVNWEDWKKPR